MKLSGQHELTTARDEIYKRLLDTDRLRQCMPGCEQLEETGDGQFSLTFGVPVPAIKGFYTGSVNILDREPPRSFRMKIDAKGKNGFILADARMRLEPNGGGCVVHYEADAQVGGPAASVGQRVLVGIARRQIQQMMLCIDSAERRANVFARILGWIKAKLHIGRERAGDSS